MIYGWNKNLTKRLHKFAERNEISFSEMKDLVMSGDIMTIYATKKSGANMVREMYLIAGTPSGRAMGGFQYWKKGYMIMWDFTKNGYRTIIFKNIDKVKTFEGRTLYIK